MKSVKYTKKKDFFKWKSLFFCAKNRKKNKYIRCIEDKIMKYYNEATIT